MSAPVGSPWTHQQRYEHGRATCKRKITYPSRMTAANAATILGWLGKSLQPYRCDFCADWHLATPKDT